MPRVPAAGRGRRIGLVRVLFLGTKNKTTTTTIIIPARRVRAGSTRTGNRVHVVRRDAFLIVQAHRAVRTYLLWARTTARDVYVVYTTTTLGHGFFKNVFRRVKIYRHPRPQVAP